MCSSRRIERQLRTLESMSELWRDPELDEMIRNLNRETGEPDDRVDHDEAPWRLDSPWRQDEPRASAERLAVLVAAAAEQLASDLLLVPGVPPTARVHGRLTPIAAELLDGDDVWELVRPVLRRRDRQQLEAQGSVDVGTSLAASAAELRVRINVHRQQQRTAASVRILPSRVPSLDELGLPVAVGELADVGRGLILVCGPTGSGKSSTLAAMVDRINRSRPCHIVTLEDPVEFSHGHRSAIVEQVEVGTDVPSFPAGLRAALRQDPDVLLIGEMRDLETVGTALTAAETGHLILATLHTNDAVQTVHRVVDVFPAGQQAQVRHQLSLALTAIVCQQLVPRSDGDGRVVAVEILGATDAVRNHIRRNAIEQLYNEMLPGQRRGMVRMEDSLARLVQSGTIAKSEALLRTHRSDELERALGRPTVTS